MARPGEMEQVELLEASDAPDTPDTSGTDDVDRAREALRAGLRDAFGWLRRHPVPVACVAAVVAVAVAVPAVVAGRASRERAAALARTPGVLAVMEAAPEVVWTSAASPGDFVLGDGRAWVRDGSLVIWNPGLDGGQSMRALDVRTGAPLWDTALTAWPDLADPETLQIDDPTTCVAPQGPLVACLVPDTWELETDTEVGPVARPTSMRLRVFDAVDGEVVLDRETTLGSVVALGGDVVLAQLGDVPGGQSSLTRLDPATGEPRWSVDVRRGWAGLAYPRVQVLGDQLAVRWLGSTHLFTDDGEPAGGYDTDSVQWLRGQSWTGQAVLRSTLTGDRVELGRSYPAWISTDDGTAPEMLVLRNDDGLRVVDTGTGTVAWRLTELVAYGPSTILVADGRIGYLVDGALTVRDLRTGQTVWTQPADGPHGQSVVTDGRHLLILATGRDRSVVAYDADDGDRAWAVEVPGSVESLVVVDHRLFGIGSEGIVALEAPQVR